MTLATTALAAAPLSGGPVKAGDDMEMRVLDGAGGESAAVPVLTDGGAPSPPIGWHPVDDDAGDRPRWRLRIRVLPVDRRRTLTVRVIRDVDERGVPAAEPLSFTCAGEVDGAATRCTSDGEGRYVVQWPRSWGPYASISSDLAVGTELRYTAWAVEMSAAQA